MTIKKSSNPALAVMMLVVFLLGNIVGANIVSKNGSIYGKDGEKKTRERIVAELDQKLKDKAQKNLIPISASTLSLTEKAQLYLHGEASGIDQDKKILDIKVENRYNIGSLISYLDEPDFYVKKVIVNDATKIIEKKRKSTEQYQSEINEYREGMKKMEEGKMLPTPPSVYIETEISLKDVQNNSRLYIEAEKDFSLKNDNNIIAKKIEVNF